MFYQMLSDDAIIRGFREGNANIIRKYFYGYCRVGYHIFDRRYQLSVKQNLDFMSLAHQYALYLMEHDWRPLEDHSPAVSLRTWLINGFRYVVLDALKWYRKEYGSITFEDYIQSFDVTSDLRLQFNRMVEDVCDHLTMSRQDRLIIDMILLQGFKAKEVAEKMGVTPSAISQKYKKLKEQIIVPYFKENFDMNLDMPEVALEDASCRRQSSISYSEMPMSGAILPDMLEIQPLEYLTESDMAEVGISYDSERRTTPELITVLHPGEIFVFGSNLRGLHGGGAAYMAYKKFGAIMGQGVGLQGQSYAIPTMQGGANTIRPYVDEMIDFARQHPDLTFLVTRIGCGIAGFNDSDIAPLFEQAHGIDNIVLPPGW